MTNPPIQPSGSPELHGAKATPKPAAGPAGPANPAFRALLERLQAQAQELEQRTGGLEAPEHLAEAVDIARASLDDALSLGDRLLEAYRGAQQRGETDTHPDRKEDRR